MTNYQFTLNKALTKYPKARKIAVENFTATADKLDYPTSMNLAEDTKAYKWNAHTVNAIRYVLQNKGQEDLATASRIGNRGFVLPTQDLTTEVEDAIVQPAAPKGWDQIEGDKPVKDGGRICGCDCGCDD